MKLFAVFTFVSSVLLLQMAQAKTIQEATTRIIAAQQYLNSEVSKLKSSIPQSISDTKSTLNNRANTIKGEIRAGPSSCTVWLSQIDSILQHQVNFMYGFRSCEMTSEINDLSRTKNSLADLLKNGNKLIALCAISKNCQSSIDSLYNSVGMIENSIAAKSTTISTSSSRCVSEKSKTMSDLMESAYSSWKKCS